MAELQEQTCKVCAICKLYTNSKFQWQNASFLEINEGALEKLSEGAEDSQINSESRALLVYEINFEFISSTIIWHELLFAIFSASKSLQNIENLISPAISV